MDVTTGQEVLELLVAAVLGAAIGLERELRAQPAGLRTHLLVALGAASFTIAGDVAGSDPTRVAAQVVTGIGFLGAGAILRDGGSIKGLTTAASLWVTAAAGVACGLARPLLAVVAVLVSLTALTVLRTLERDVFPRRRGAILVLEVTATAHLHEVLHGARQVLGRPVEVTAVDRAAGDRSVLTLGTSLTKGYDLLDLATRLRALEGVVGVELGS